MTLRLDSTNNFLSKVFMLLMFSILILFLWNCEIDEGDIVALGMCSDCDEQCCRCTCPDGSQRYACVEDEDECSEFCSGSTCP